MPLLGREFYSTDAKTLAERLLGCVLVREVRGARVSGRIVEVEAYLGVKDRCSHAYGGRRTARNESMYGIAGLAYVYFTYGMHYCVNVVCGEVGEPSAVLVRALEPVEGLAFMKRRRGAVARRERDLCSGPGKLCRALEIDKRLDGVDLCEGKGLWIEGDGRRVEFSRLARVGVGEGHRWAEARLRYLDPASHHVSVRAG